MTTASRPEYALFGTPPGATDETLLLAMPGGEPITDRGAAERYKETLTTAHGCTGVRIVALDGTVPDFAAAVGK